MTFEIKHPQFEGPLDVLLDLIERRELHVSDIALAKVTDDFLTYATNSSDFPLAESAQFAFICSTLLLLKSKALLPGLALTAEEQGSIVDLERRLKLLERFRMLARGLTKHLGVSPLYLPKERPIEPLFAPPRGLSAALLRRAIQMVLSALPKVEKLTQATVKKVISLEEMIVSLKDRITGALRMSFKDFSAAHKAERITIIIGFLAMLELVKQGIIAAVQGEKHGDIVMETEALGTPRY
jgi:segregation and condensation protein A